MTDITARLRDLSTRMSKLESRELLMGAAERIAELKRRQIPTSWASPDGTEWSGLSGDGVVDVRGSKADIDVVQSWRHAKDRLAWFEREYTTAQARESQLRAEVERLKTEADGEFVQAAVRVMRANPGFTARDYAETGISADDFESFFTEDMNEAWRQVERLKAEVSDAHEALRTRYGRGPK